MKKNYDIINIFIASLVIICGMTLFLWVRNDEVHNYREAITPHTGNIQLFSLSGAGEYWEVEDFNLVKTKTSIRRGSGELKYLGDKEEIIDSNFLKYTFYEKHEEKKAISVLQGVKSSDNGNISILDNLKIGIIEGPLSDSEELKTKQDIENSYLEIEWADSKGVLKKEIIQLKAS